MRGALVTALTVGFAGCADPGSSFSQLVYVNQFQGKYRVNGPTYEMQFPDDDIDLKLPTTLLVDGQPALAEAMCPVESLAGIAVYPAAIAAGDEPGTSTLTFPERGKAVVQTAVEFDVPYGCNGLTEHLHGTTTYTFFPSGRIVRHDMVRPSDNTLVGSASCGCNPGGAQNWVFTSFWTFNADQLIGPSGDPIGGGLAPQVCAELPTTIVGLAWSPGVTRLALNGHPASVFNFDTGPSLDPGYREVTSALQIGFKDQGATCATVQANLVDNALKIDGVTIESNEHGLYVDDNIHNGGEFQIIAQEGNVPPFAVILDIGTAEHARVSRNDYTVQTTTDGRQLFWFNDGMSQFDSINITPY